MTTSQPHLTSTSPLRHWCKACVLLLVLSWTPLAAADGMDNIELELPSPWESVEPSGLADREWKHGDDDLTVQLIVIPAQEGQTVKDDDGNDVEVTGSLIVEDWDQQFVDGGPLVSVERHEEQSHAGVEGIFGDMTWNNRRGLYFGFSSADLAAAHGVPLERDQFAFFVLCEGSTLGDVDVQERCTDVFTHLNVLP